MRLDRRAVIAAAAASVAAPALSAPAMAASLLASGDMSLGKITAPVKVVEYASLTCNHCATFATEVFPAFKAKYIDTGRVHYTLKELLTDPQQVAAAGFLMARCAGPGKYFDVVDAVFRSQEQWGRTELRPLFNKIAADHGLTEAQFTACIQDEAALSALNARGKRAVEVDKVTSTPTFFVNGRLAKAGVMSLAELDAAIAAAGPGGR